MIRAEKQQNGGWAIAQTGRAPDCRRRVWGTLPPCPRDAAIAVCRMIRAETSGREPWLRPAIIATIIERARIELTSLAAMPEVQS